MAKRFRLALWHDGMEVASVDAPDIESARREIMHYASQYAQDGPCTIKGDGADKIVEALNLRTASEIEAERLLKKRLLSAGKSPE